MSYQRPQDPYIHSNASQYDERYQQGYGGSPAAGYRDYPDQASVYQGSAYRESSEGIYGGQAAGYGAGAAVGAGYGQQRNLASQAAATYSYAKPKKGVSKWIKIGIPILILVIAGAVVGGIFGARAAKDNNSSSGSSSGSGSSGSGSTPNVQGAALTAAQQAAKNGGNNMLFYQGTDPYGNPAYVSSNVDTSAPAYSGVAHNQSCSDSWTATNSLTNLRPHPRIMTTQAEWNCLPTKIANDAYLTVWNNTIFTNATNWAAQPPVAFVADGGFTGSGILDVSRNVQQRVKSWAYAYKLSNNTYFKDRLFYELNIAAGNNASFFYGQNGTRWNAAHFLDVAEMTSAFAMAYDWLYSDWNTTERTVIRDAIFNYGLLPGLNQYATGDGWWKEPSNGDGNWNCVCNGGLLTGALAIRGDGNANQTATADSIINSALTNMKANCMRGVYDDGTWAETANYWYFGTNAQGRALSALISATGTDQGLMAQNPNWYKTSDFHMYVSGPGGLFDYGDNGPNKFATTANQLMLYSKLTGDARPAVYQRDRADASFDPLSMFWYEPTAKGAFWNGLALDRFFNDTRGTWGSMRSSWTDPSAVFVGVKASALVGHQTHGDLDAGDFIIDALGTRWAGEYGSGNYLSTDYFSNETQQSARWTYYRKATDGQNTLVINMQNQNVSCLPSVTMDSTGVAQTGDLSFKPAVTDTAQFIADLSNCYNQPNNTVQRGIRLLNGRRQILVQDEIAQSSSITDVQWRVQTNGTVTLSADGKTATLTQSSITDPNAGVTGKVSLGGTKTMKVQILSPSNAVFTLDGPPATRIYGTAVFTAAPEDSDIPNTGATALQIKLGGTQSGPQTVQVLWQPQWDSLSAADQATPKLVPLSQWTLTSHN